MCKRKREFIGLLMLIGALVAQVLAGFGFFKTLDPHDYQDCLLVRGPVGSEDVQVHKGIAFISSDDRRQWLPSGLLFDAHEKMRTLTSKEQGGIYVLDLKEASPSTRRLPIKDNPGSHFHPHGISLVDNNGEVLLYVISHSAGPDEVRVFRVDYEGESPVGLQWLRTLAHPLMALNSNDLHVRSFDGVTTVFITLAGATQTGTLSAIWELFAKRPWSSVLKCVDGKSFTCEVFASELQYPNGVNTSPDGQLVYVALTLVGKLNVYSRTGLLLAEVDADSGLDNIDVDPTSGDIYIGSHPILLAFVKHKDDASASSPSQVLRIRRCNAAVPVHSSPNASSEVYGKCQRFKTALPVAQQGTTGSGFIVDEVYLTEGHATPHSLSASAVGAYDPLTRSLVIGGVFDNGVVVCRNR